MKRRYYSSHVALKRKAIVWIAGLRALLAEKEERRAAKG